jgi:hypothetical protein
MTSIAGQFRITKKLGDFLDKYPMTSDVKSAAYSVRIDFNRKFRITAELASYGGPLVDLLNKVTCDNTETMTAFQEMMEVECPQLVQFVQDAL